MYDQLPVPAHDGVGFHYIGYFLKGLTTEAMSNFSECSTLSVGEPYRGLELGFQDPVLCNEVLVTQKEFLIHCPCDVGQYTQRIHCNPHRRLQLFSQLYAAIEARYKSMESAKMLNSNDG